MKTSFLVAMSVFVTLLGASLAAHEPPPDPSLAAHPPAVRILTSSATSELPEPAPELTPDVLGDPSEIQSLAAAVSGTPLYTRQTTSNTAHEVESAITAVTVDNEDHTAVAFMRKVGSVFKIQTISSKTPAATGLTHWVAKTPGLPENHNASVDPVLDVNPYDNSPGSRHIFLGGLTYNTSSSSDRAIVVWDSDDGGESWSAPVTVDSDNSNGFRLDKPDLAVSWYLFSRGNVYVAYMRVKQISPTTWGTELRVARSIDAGVNWVRSNPIATGHIHAPQIVVSSNTGKVYVIWLDLDSHQIKMASSLYNQFGTWTAQASLNGVGRFLKPCETDPVTGLAGCDAIAAPSTSVCPGGIQAVTVPQARYNWIKDQIGLVWHERESTTATTTDVYFSAFGVSGWLTPKRVNPQTGKDQWYPALDYDSTGDYLVVFYDRRQDSSNTLYKEAWAHVNSSGTVLANGFVSGAFTSNPTEAHTFTIGANTYCFKGEYQDIWFWPYTDANGPRFHALWTGHPSTTIDDEVELSAVK